ncbi:MAG: hypothetical protein CVV32_03630 [Methanomicrobiales archaeon HGW-Methanomicrobiales-3]|jgi:hypothetical protein|nr:MAG: hypothetical protein CVV32_03630 [Methanomicrobiales archaeon HGW-Methanomicrobiales-3]
MFMAIPFPHFRILFVFILVFFIGPASGAINDISPGGTVFIGEQGLDITHAMAGDSQIGWWASAASIAESSPSQIISISSLTSFSITPSAFASYTGSWLHLDPAGKANGTAFNVVDPNLEIRVEDTTVGVDVTDKWVSTDDEIRFRIDTNLVPIAQRSGVTSVPITIKVQDPSGSTYSSLVNSAGTATSLVDYPITTTPQYTAAIWDTGQRSIYSPGTYVIWAECNVNSMKDNYNNAGKTVSQKVTVQNQDHNPLITGNYPQTTATQGITPVMTTITTPLPVSPTPAVVKTPTITSTTIAPVVQTETQVPTPVAPTPSPTHSPGFEGIFAGVALMVAILAWCRKD